MNKQISLVCWLLLFAALAGCGPKRYPNTPEKNLLVRTTLSGSLFSSVEAFLHLYDPRDGSRKGYLGVIDLKNGDTEIGMTVDRPVCLDFVLRADAFIHKGTLFTPKPGVRYIALVRYVDRIYSISVHEAGTTGLPGREIQSQGAKCPPL